MGQKLITAVQGLMLHLSTAIDIHCSLTYWRLCAEAPAALFLSPHSLVTEVCLVYVQDQPEVRKS